MSVIITPVLREEKTTTAFCFLNALYFAMPKFGN